MLEDYKLNTLNAYKFLLKQLQKFLDDIHASLTGNKSITGNEPTLTFNDTTGGSTNYKLVVFEGQFTIQQIDDDGGFVSNPILIDGNAETLHLKSADSTLGGSILAKLDANKAWHPPSLADTAAVNGSVYFSTTGSKLVYKDAGGSVHALY